MRPPGQPRPEVTPTGTGTCVHDAFGRLGEASLLPVGTGPGLNIRIFRLSQRSASWIRSLANSRRRRHGSAASGRMCYSSAAPTATRRSPVLNPPLSPPGYIDSWCYQRIPSERSLAPQLTGSGSAPGRSGGMRTRPDGSSPVRSQLRRCLRRSSPTPVRPSWGKSPCTISREPSSSSPTRAARLRLSSATMVADVDRQGRRGNPPEQDAPQ